MLIDATNPNEFEMNRMANAHNKFQGDRKKVLCVCSAGLLRSPTAAVVLAGEPYGYNTRACGLTKEFALIPFDKVLAYWADEIVCMEVTQREKIESLLKQWGIEGKTVIALSIPDNFEYRNERLIELIKEKYSG